MSRPNILAAAAAAALLAILAAIPPPSAAEFWPYYHVHIINNLENDKVLFVHCHSRDGRDLGDKHVNHNGEFEWRFKLNYFTPTIWGCTVAPPDHNRHAYFHAFENEIKDYDHHVYWAIKEDGVFIRNPDGLHFDIFDYDWKPGPVVEWARN